MPKTAALPSYDYLGPIVQKLRAHDTPVTIEELAPPHLAAPPRTTVRRQREDARPPWMEPLLLSLRAMDPAGFERLCQRLLREAGFTQVEVTGRGGDGGVDGAAVLRVNLLSFHVLFQCKRWSSPIGSSVVRDFRGAMVGRADKGLIITTSTFTAEARREAVRDGAATIDLIEGEALCELLRQHRIGVIVRMIEDVSVDESALAAI